MKILAAQVKELRDRTGAGMMECKKALTACDGDLDRAMEELRKAGITKAGNKASRIAAEGAIVIMEKNGRALIMEINSETDFVARDTNFIEFCKAVAATALAAQETNVDVVTKLPLVDQTSTTVEEARQKLVATVGENVQIRRISLSNLTAGGIGTYLHGNRIGVLVELDVDNKTLARDIAMHIAASKPLVIDPSQVSAELVAKEKEIYLAQAATSGKPPEILDKMVAGRLKKYLDEISLLGQPFVKDPDTTVGSLLNKNRAKVLAFVRYEVGEGIEKTTEDFRAAVLSQINPS